ncbi:ATPase associated with various cellular activities, AAA_5 [Deinococcus geothermalis DSM 11300]|uniref:ATPase associated with various cellular activities, AAA_5 n=1 Tax=Deinococcus geothermalis (strain DSM 11300 / CIP 105573 / AG-3a) TaxID=319795 RepID=Q1J1W9_DEIGD|nr:MULTISPECIES: MoxR family ATPase [Deinococcus]ABF44515.1 ATPase associated with various cellular activities, AAA_5 [Deinococcus geothermalis DSM 11300]MBI0445718.1 MoxR family ATPase [Deinococcus sp. DB0503]TDE86358.1 MoxR family ATPase [Deinococcus sp. S9]
MTQSPSPPDLQAAFRARGYVAGDALVTALRLVVALGKPLLLEGPAGVGKTEAAKTLAAALGTRLIRLQCYEGLDAQAALYEWNYARQLLHLRAAEVSGRAVSDADLYGPQFLMQRPLLEAIRQEVPPVLLIDEVDRADDAFEAFLLELLAEWQVTVPELGTLTAIARPHVLLTSNRARELSDALRRRCLYLWVDYPTEAQELEIVRARLPGIQETLAAQVTRAVHALRELPLGKPPGVAETLDWAAALVALHRDWLDAEALDLTLGAVLKLHEDQQLARATLHKLAPP